MRRAGVNKATGVYTRVSSRAQDCLSQMGDLKDWASARPGPIRWFEDTATGRNLERPQMELLLEECRMGRITTLVVWRLDRLGRTASGLTALFEDLESWDVTLISLRDGIDLSTPAGRLMANVIASVAAYETEVRGERVAAGIAAARKKGKTWGGSVKGRRLKVTLEVVQAVKDLHAMGKGIARIARLVGVSRPTVYAILADVDAA